MRWQRWGLLTRIAAISMLIFGSILGVEFATVSTSSAYYLNTQLWHLVVALPDKPYSYNTTQLEVWPNYGDSLGYPCPSPDIISMVLAEPGVDTGNGTTADEVRAYSSSDSYYFYLNVTRFQDGGNNGNAYWVRFSWVPS